MTLMSRLLLLTSGKFSEMTSTKPLVCSSGAISAGHQGEKSGEKGVASLFSHRTLAGGKVAELLSWQPWLFQPSLAGSDRCVKPSGQLESRGLTLSCLFSVGKFWFSEKKEGVRMRDKKWKKASEWEQTWSVTSFLLFPLCNQRDIAGGKLWELSLPTGLRASCRDRWLTEKPQLRDLWCSRSVHISLTQSTAWTQLLRHPSDYFQ